MLRKLLDPFATAGRCALCLALLALGLAAVAAPPLAAEPTCKLDPKQLTICVGPYALCDKSTCKKGPAGDNVECTCPVLHGPAIASLEQLGGKCAPPDKGTVYSLFSLKGYGTNGTLGCPAGSQFAQCWNATCRLRAGGKTAVCTCPLCPGPFVTPGGACNPSNCQNEIMVGAAFPVEGGGCKTSSK